MRWNSISARFSVSPQWQKRGSVSTHTQWFSCVNVHVDTLKHEHVCVCVVKMITGGILPPLPITHQPLVYINSAIYVPLICLILSTGAHYGRRLFVSRLALLSAASEPSEESLPSPFCAPRVPLNSAPYLAGRRRAPTTRWLISGGGNAEGPALSRPDGVNPPVHFLWVEWKI